MNRSTHFRPHFEQLETRAMLAGDVSVSVGEVLELRGDEADNVVRITQNAADRIRVEGLEGTRINGEASLEFDGSGLEKVDVLLFGGSDELTIVDLRASTDINIEMNNGDDLVNLQGVEAGVVLTVKMDDGMDRVIAENVHTGSDFNIETGQGSAEVAVSSSTVGGTLKVVSLDSEDMVDLSELTILKDLEVNTGKGNDAVTLRDVSVTLTATIITDLGDDRVDASHLETGEDLNVEAGEGHDEVRLTDVTSHKNIQVDMQTGDDFVGVTRVVAAQDAVFLGGDGFNTFDNRGVSGGEDLEIKEFDRFIGGSGDLPGDYDGSGRVDQADLDLVLLNWGADAATPPPGWAANLPTGAIDQEELDAVLLNWGSAASAGPAEPTTLPSRMKKGRTG